MRTPTFVVGTGRCGSTMLSKMLREHPQVLSCAATVRPLRSTWRDLPEETARALTEACRPGFERLCAAGVHYDVWDFAMGEARGNHMEQRHGRYNGCLCEGVG